MASSVLSMPMAAAMMTAVSSSQVVRPEGWVKGRGSPTRATDVKVGEIKKGQLIVNQDGSVDEKTAEIENLSAGGRRDGRRHGWGDRRRRSEVSIQFGGASHGSFTDQSTSGWTGQHLARPEAVKSEACVNNACQDCTTAESCWHGVVDGKWGYMRLKVPAGASFTHYTAEVWVRCSSSSGELKFKAWELVNGELVLTINGAERHRASAPETAYTRLGLPQSERMRVAFAPKDRSISATSLFYLSAYDVDPSVDSCMTAKECLDQLGDGSDAAFELRNANSKQLRCLKGDMSAMSTALKAKCELWNQCLGRTGKKDGLLALLKAATAPKPGSFITGVVIENRTRESDLCVHPAVDDPESWNCECAEEWLAICSSGDVESCLQNLMCNHAGVCDSWKQNHCLTSSSSLMAERSSKSSVINGFDDNLDGAVQGKCSQ